MSEKAQPAAVLKPTVNSVYASVVNVRNPRISNAPNSARQTSPTSTAPPRMASLAWPTVTFQNVRSRPSPRLRATSSCAGSALRRFAATGRKTSG